MSLPKIHYAQSDITACLREVANWRADEPMIKHTTIEENVTCKQCQRVLQDKKKLERYLREWCY